MIYLYKISIFLNYPNGLKILVSAARLLSTNATFIPPLLFYIDLRVFGEKQTIFCDKSNKLI